MTKRQLVLQRKCISILLSAVLLAVPMGTGWAASSAEAQPTAQSFKDVQGNWAQVQIDKWAALGLANGSEGKFRPGDEVSRAEFSKLINTLFGFSAKSEQSFSDVATGKWYADQVAIAKQAGYIAGYPDGQFKPEVAVTRQEAAKMVAAIFPLVKADTNSLSGFADKSKIAAFAEAPLASLVAGGYIKGFSDDTLRPLQPISRAEAIVLLDRLAGEIVHSAGTYENLKASGNILIASSGATIKDAEVNGDVLVTIGVGEGDVTLEHMSIKGTLYVNGGGSHSVHVNNSQVGSIIVSKSEGPVRIVLGGSSQVGEMNIVSGATIEVGEQAVVTKLIVDEKAAGTALSVKGSITELQTASSGTTLNDKPVAEGSTYTVSVGGVVKDISTPAATATPSPSPAVSVGGGAVSVPTTAPTSTPSQTQTAPKLGAETTDNVLGKDVKITFTDSPAWREAITDVVLDGKKLVKDTDYVITSGVLTIRTAAITAVGDVAITIKATGYTDATLLQTIGKWDLIWSDEFNGSGTNMDTNGVDLDKWAYQEGTGADYGLDGWGNNEQQYYSKNNLKVQDGKLTITAKKQTVNGKPYTSGRLWTSPTFTKQYGKFEARMKLPEGQGLWPAFWMMPKDSEYGTWASSGELDIMEARGRLTDQVAGTIHFGKQWPNNKSTGGDYLFPNGDSITNYHTYGVEWEPGQIRWYVDGIVFKTVNEWSSEGIGQPDKYAFPAPFNKPFYIILNMAVGGVFDSNLLPPDSKVPAEMQVDYVRAYELSGKPYHEPVEPVLTNEPIPAEARQPVDGSYIADPNFDKGLTDINSGTQTLSADKWNFLHTPDYSGAGSASIEAIDGRNYAKIIPTNGGNQSYALQMIQYAPLVRGHIYKLSFDAKASEARSMLVKMGGDGDNSWSAYSDNFDVALKTGLQHYEYRFQMANTTDLAARLEFNVGLNTKTVWIGNVRLEETDQIIDPNGAKTPLDDGNHIYNGGFDLGTMDRLKYWSFKTSDAAATATVDPSTQKLTVDIQDAGTAPEAIQLEQQGINLLQSDTYELTFDAKAAVGRTIGVRFVSKDGATVYYQKGNIAVGTTSDKKTVTFEMPSQISDTEGKLILDLGSSSASVTLDNVRLIRTTNNNADYSKVSLYPLNNGDFSAGLTGWEPFTQGAAANFSASDGVAKVAVSSVGTEAWNVMLNQSNLNLTKGFTYVLAFDAKASVARDTQATLENAAYTRRFDSNAITLGTDWKHFEYTFKPSVDDNVALKFLLGKTPQAPAGAHDVFFRNVVLEVQNAPLKRPQTVSADSTDIRVGQPIQLSFTDNEAWRTAITSVLVDGHSLPANKFTVQPGVIVFATDAFDSLGTHQITVKATGYADVNLSQSLIASDGNLVTNGSFDKGTASWEHWVGTKGDSTFEVVDQTANLDIHYFGGVTLEWGDPMPVSWYTQLTQSGIKLEAGKTYELNFRAWSTIDRPIMIELGGYKDDQKVAFSITSDSAAVYTAVIKPTAATTLSLKYLLGNVITATATTPDVEHLIRIDDISLKEVKSGPALTNDTTDNKIGNSIEVNFADQEAWRSAISAVKINGVTAPMDKVVIEAGRILLDASLFPSINTYTISVLAEGYGANEVTQQVTTASPNIAIGKTATASTGSQSASKAFDGIGSTRWESEANDPQWVAVDLGALYSIDTLVLNWEGAFGKAYKIQVATAAVPSESDWTDVYTEAAGNGGFDTIVLNNAEARHVRMLGSARGTNYGYSLWEVEVHGVLVGGQEGGGSPEPDPTKLTPPAVTADTSGNKQGSNLELTFTANSDWENAISGITVGAKELVKDIDYVVTSGIVTLKASVFTEAGSYPVVIKAAGYGDAHVTQVVVAADVIVNLALHRTVVASSSNSTFDPNVITDGNLESRWEANWNLGLPEEWVYVDLGSVQDIQRLVIKWEKAYASRVEIQVTDTVTEAGTADWATVETLDRNIEDGTWTETVDLSNKEATGRYVRLYMTAKHFPPYGPSLFELSVY